MANTYIKNPCNNNEDFVNVIGRLSISALIIYYAWFNEYYGHNTLIVYGSFIVMSICMIYKLFKDRYLNAYAFHSGIWVNFFIILYSVIPGMFIAYDKMDLLNSLKLVSQYAIIAYCIYYFSLKTPNGIDWVLKTIEIGVLLCCYFLYRHPIQVINGRSVISVSNNPNTLGFILVMGVFSVVYRFNVNNKRSYFDLVLVIIMTNGVIMTGSRKSLITVAIILVIGAIEIIKEIMKGQEGQRKFIALAFAFVIVFLAGRYLLNTYRLSTVSERMDTMLDEDSNNNRIYYYRKAWEIFLAKPILGGGLNQFSWWAWGVPGGYAHSTYAEAVADFGFIGCCLYFYPIVLAGYQLITYSSSSDKQYKTRIIFALWCGEMFMGIGQIFFLDIMHFLAWAIIYFTIQMPQKPQALQKSKYLKY